MVSEIIRNIRLQKEDYCPDCGGELDANGTCPVCNPDLDPGDDESEEGVDELGFDSE